MTRPSLELLNVLVLCVSLTILLKDQIHHEKSSLGPLENNLGSKTRNLLVQQRDLEETPFKTDFSFFLGDWYDCMHTSLTTFSGETSEKDILDTSTCENNNLGKITTIKDGNAQALQFDIFMLEKCSFHGIGGAGQRPCPNDSLGSDSSSIGRILVKYSFKGVGSFADTDRIKFFADQSYIRNLDGQWKTSFKRSKIENADSMICKKHMDGIACDWHINEYRTAAIEEDSGCQKNGVCKPGLGIQQCKLAGGAWTKECPRTKYVSNGFLYDTYASYYLVKDASQCNIECQDKALDEGDEDEETGER